MAAIVSNLRNTITAGLMLTVIMVIVVSQTPGAEKFAVDHSYTAFFLRWLHVLSGIICISLLWYLILFRFLTCQIFQTIKSWQ